MILSMMTLGYVGSSALLIAVVVIVGLLCSGCGPSPPPKWSNFHETTPASDADDEEP